MAQFARPDSTVSAGLWEPQGGPSTLWEAIDEATASDTDFIEALNGENTTCELGLNTVTDPAVSTGHFIRFRMQGTGSGGPERCEVQLFDGASQIATTGNQTSRGAWGDKTYELSAAEADAIANYADLRFKIISSSLGGTEDMWVSWVEFEVPDAAAAPSGAGTQTLAPLTQAGLGGMRPSGVGAQMLPSLIQSGSGAQKFVGAGVQTLAALIQAGQGAEIFIVGGAQILAALVQSGAAVMPPDGAGVQTLTALLQAGNAAQTFAAVGAQALAALVQSGASVQILSGTASQVFAALTQAGVGAQVAASVTVSAKITSSEVVVIAITRGDAARAVVTPTNAGLATLTLRTEGG